MNPNQRVREEFEKLQFPERLMPPANLADSVLRTMRRRRTRRLVGTVAALSTVAVASAFILPSISLGEGGDESIADAGAAPTAGITPRSAGAAPTEAGDTNQDGLSLSASGGGPQAVQAYRKGETTFLLDLATGRYHELPFVAVLSPDLSRAAINANGRVGLAERDDLVRDGEKAVRWLDLPLGNGPSWSPDGKALLWTAIDKGESRVRFTAYRFDVDSERTTPTAINANILGSTVGWAADSTRYLALQRKPDGGAGVLRYIGPDGALGAEIDEASGFVDGASAYSPSRRYAVTDASEIMGEHAASVVLDVSTGQAVAALPLGSKPIGWYDESTVVQLAPDRARQPVIQLVDATTGKVSRSIGLSGVGEVTRLQIGSSAGLSGAAAHYSF